MVAARGGISLKRFIVLASLFTIALAAPAASSVAVAPPTLHPLREGQTPTEIVVAFRGAIPDDVAQWIASQGGRLLARDDTLGFVTASFANVASTDRAIDAALARFDVRSAERDGFVHSLQIPALPPPLGVTPNDPMYGQQWGWQATMANEAWAVTRGSHSVKVAVLDTGMETTHPDLAANVCGPFTSFNPSEPTIADGFGHGTHVSGTIAAATNNGVGVSGMSDSCLMGAKVLSASGGGQWTWVASGIAWAADNGAKIESMSLGGGAPPTVVADAVKYAYARNVLIVAAAGNSGCPGTPVGEGSVGFPAAYDEVLAVSALDSPGVAPAGYSSCGADVEISAPGSAVLSTWRGGAYVSISGTSMATPHVSGIAALVAAQHPGISAVGLRCVVDLSSEDLGPPGRDFKWGWGRANAFKALELDRALTASGGFGVFEQACAAGAPAIFN